jgi:hypothetical protein
MDVHDPAAELTDIWQDSEMPPLLTAVPLTCWSKSIQRPKNRNDEKSSGSLTSNNGYKGNAAGPEKRANGKNDERVDEKAVRAS